MPVIRFSFGVKETPRVVSLPERETANGVFQAIGAKSNTTNYSHYKYFLVNPENPSQFAREIVDSDTVSALSRGGRSIRVVVLTDTEAMTVQCEGEAILPLPACETSHIRRINDSPPVVMPSAEIHHQIVSEDDVLVQRAIEGDQGAMTMIASRGFKTAIREGTAVEVMNEAIRSSVGDRNRLQDAEQKIAKGHHPPSRAIYTPSSSAAHTIIVRFGYQHQDNVKVLSIPKESNLEDLWLRLSDKLGESVFELYENYTLCAVNDDDDTIVSRELRESDRLGDIVPYRKRSIRLCLVLRSSPIKEYGRRGLKLSVRHDPNSPLLFDNSYAAQVQIAKRNTSDKVQRDVTADLQRRDSITPYEDSDDDFPYGQDELLTVADAYLPGRVRTLDNGLAKLRGRATSPSPPRSRSPVLYSKPGASSDSGSKSNRVDPSLREAAGRQSTSPQRGGMFGVNTRLSREEKSPRDMPGRRTPPLAHSPAPTPRDTPRSDNSLAYSPINTPRTETNVSVLAAAPKPATVGRPGEYGGVVVVEDESKNNKLKSEPAVVTDSRGGVSNKLSSLTTTADPPIAPSQPSRQRVLDVNTKLLGGARDADVDFIRQLIKAGADPNSKGALWKDTALHRAAEIGNITAVSELVEAGCDVNLHEESFQDTALHLAARHGHAPIVKLLLSHGANTFARAICGSTPLHFAARKGQLAIVKLLIDGGSDMLSRGMYENSALHEAAKYGHTEVVLELLSRGCSPDVTAMVQQTPLHVACQKGHAEVVNLLLKYYANVNVQDQFGFTPLHEAVVAGSLPIVRALLSSNANVHVCNMLDKTAFHLASEKGHVVIVQVLVEAGGSTEKADRDGRTALDLAKTDAVFKVLTYR